MPCYHPLDAKLSPSGKPIFKNNVNYGRFTKLIKLPCGRCIGCKLERSRQTAVRLMHEAQLHKKNSFLTLTYSTNNLPRPGRDCETQRGPGPRLGEEPQVDSTHTREPHAHEEEEAATLSKRDLQLFTKRLNEDQRRLFGEGVKYYAVGEYGDTKGRPHYHAVVFGEDFTGDRYQWRTNGGNILYRSPRLERLWPLGTAEIGELTFESAAYVARYITKKITGDKADEHYRRTDSFGQDYWLEPEFNVMSRGGRTGKGIAHGWYAKFGDDTQHGYVIVNGRKAKPPRYYDQLMKELKPIQWEAIHKDRLARALATAHDNTPERLRVRKVVAEAALRNKKRNLE